MLEARIVERDESGNEATVLFPEAHDLNGPGEERFFTNTACYSVDVTHNELFKKILKSELGLAMFDGTSVRNSQPLLEALPFTIDKEFKDVVYTYYAKPIICNLATLGGLALMFHPKKEMYWRIKIK